MFARDFISTWCVYSVHHVCERTVRVRTRVMSLAGVGYYKYAYCTVKRPQSTWQLFHPRPHRPVSISSTQFPYCCSRSQCGDIFFFSTPIIYYIYTIHFCSSSTTWRFAAVIAGRYGRKRTVCASVAKGRHADRILVTLAVDFEQHEVPHYDNTTEHVETC